MSVSQVTMPDGAVLNVRRQGSGAPLVLVSGLGGTAAFWQPLVECLSEQFELITFDQRGIAGATRGSDEVDIARLAEDVLVLCDALDLPQAAFLGHSTGGCIVQTIAATAPERVTRLCLSATWLRPGNYLRALFEFRLALLDSDPAAYAASAALLSYAPQWLETHWDKFETAAAKAPMDPDKKRIVAERIRALLGFDGTGQLAQIPSAPTLIIGARDDMIVPAFMQDELAAALPEARQIVLEDGGHFYPASRVGALAQHVADWMQDAPTELKN